MTHLSITVLTFQFLEHQISEYKWIYLVTSPYSSKLQVIGKLVNPSHKSLIDAIKQVDFANLWVSRPISGRAVDSKHWSG